MEDLFSQSSIAGIVGNIAPDELTFEKAIAAFQNIYMASRNLSPRTREEYKSDVCQLAAFLNAHAIVKPAEVSLSHLQSFLAHLDATRLSGITRRRKTSSIRSFFGFLTTSNLIPHNPTQQLVPPEREYKEPRYLTTGKYTALLRACSHEPRDAAIIELILQTGIKLSEVARLTIHDVELPARISRDPSNTGRISIQGKGKKNRTLPINYKAGQALKSWLAIRPDVESTALFLTKYRQILGSRSIQDIVSKYLKEAGILGASCHDLRHTFAVHHAIKGTDLRTIQTALGHANLKTTSIYISLAKTALSQQLQEHAL